MGGGRHRTGQPGYGRGVLRRSDSQPFGVMRRSIDGFVFHFIGVALTAAVGTIGVHHSFVRMYRQWG